MPTVTDNIYIERKSIKWLKDQTDKELLSVDNSFQRQYIWTTKNQARLIETILLGYAIPEIYLWERETDSESGDTRLSVIDGQQRLGSIFDFINEKFQLRTSFLDHKDADFVNKSFSELTEEQRNAIWKYPLSVRFIKENVSREDIVNMFLRLNSTNTTLNPQELRNAEFNGLFLRLANELTDLPFWEKIRLFNGYDYRRMKDIEFISSLLIFLRLGIEEETTQRNVNKVYDTFNEEYPEYEEDKILFTKLIDLFEELVDQDESIMKFISRKVHFYSLFTVIYYLYKQYGEVTNDHKKNLERFVYNYNHLNEYEGDLPGPKYEWLVEYNQLSQEGTQKRTNRIKRFEILKDFLTTN